MANPKIKVPDFGVIITVIVATVSSVAFVYTNFVPRAERDTIKGLYDSRLDRLENKIDQGNEKSEQALRKIDQILEKIGP